MRGVGTLLVAASLTWPAVAASQEAESILVGTKRAAPFVLAGADGELTGMSITLWEAIARDLEVSWELREVGTVAELLDGVGSGDFDLAVAALTLLPEREERMDFTHPFYVSGLGIAVASRGTSPWLDLFTRLVSGRFLKVAGGLSLLLAATGALLWFFERHRNAEQFGGGVLRGLGSAFWWSAVTMTTVGYGDKAPVTFWGRAVALVWMFGGVILISGFTAAIASSLTVSSLGSRIDGPEDLPDVRTATVAGTAAASWMRQERLDHRSVASVEEGLRALAAGELDALVYDAPILRYLVRRDHPDEVEVLEHIVLRQDYGFALPSGSPLREPINRLLLEKIREPWWKEVVFEHLGR